MSVRLRLRRMGKKKQPFYRIVAIDSRAARDGRYLENLGTYNPIKKPAELSVKEDRVLYWLRQGATPSDTVKSFFQQKGIMLKWHLMKQGADEALIDEEFKKWEVLQIERQKRLDALAEQQKRTQQKKKKEKVEAGAAGEVKTADAETAQAEPIAEASAVPETEAPAVEEGDAAKEAKEAKPEVTSDAETSADAGGEEAETEAEAKAEGNDKEAKAQPVSEAETSEAPENGEQQAGEEIEAGGEEKKSKS